MRSEQHTDHVSRGNTAGSQWWFATLLVMACLGVMCGQFWGLRQLSALDGQERAWNGGQKQREVEIRDSQQKLKDLKENISNQDVLQKTTEAGLVHAEQERDRLLAEVAKAKKELELIRKAGAEAETAEHTALLETQAAVAEKKAAEARASELATQEANLKTDVARLQAQQEQLTKSLTGDKAVAAKLTVDLVAERKQLVDVEKQVAAARTQLSELRASVTKSNTDLQAAIVEHGKVLRNRESLLVDVTAAEQRIAAATKTEEALLASNKELEKANQQLFQDKADLNKSVSELQTRIGDLQKQITAKTAELSAMLKKVADAQESSKQSTGSKSEKSEAKEPRQNNLSNR